MIPKHIGPHAEVLDFKPRDSQTTLVLCIWNKEYVVWTIRNDEPEYAFWGHYFGPHWSAARRYFEENR